MKGWHISDTHSYHRLLQVPKDIDIVFHTGDFSNYKDVYKNEPEARDFLNWYASLDIKYKVLIAGNHDTLAYQWNKKFRELCKHLNIIYLENETTIIEGLKIFGSPHTPQFGDWYFMKKREKLSRVWEQIEDGTDIIMVHTPPKTILDLSYSQDRRLEFCGCGALRKKILKVQPKLVMFGHIHNNKEIVNAGVRIENEWEDGKIISSTSYSNGSVVTDGKFGKLTSNGNIFEL